MITPENMKLLLDIAYNYDKKTPAEGFMKFMEETGEFAQAVLSYQKAHACGYKKKTLENVLEEAGDSITCGIAALARVVNLNDPVTVARFNEILTFKLEKWKRACQQEK